MKIRIIFLTFLLLIPVLTVMPAGAMERNVSIAPYRTVVKTWEGPWWAYKLTFEDGNTLNWIWSIKDFPEYSPGTEYRIIIKEKPVFNPPADCPNRELIYIETLEKRSVEVSSNVEIPLGDILGPYVFKDDTGRWSILNEAEMLISGENTEAQLLLALYGSFNPVGIFNISKDVYTLTDIQYDFNPDLLLDKYGDQTGEEPDKELLNTVYNSPVGELPGLLNKILQDFN